MTESKISTCLRLCMGLSIALTASATGPALASGPPSSNATGTKAPAPQLSVQDIQKQIESRLNKIWSGLPQLPPGTAILDFTINQSGALSQLSQVKSSGNANFDRAATGTIKRVIPLPNLPSHLAVNALRLRAEFTSGAKRHVGLGFAPFESFESNSPPVRPQTGTPVSTTSNSGQAPGPSHSPKTVPSRNANTNRMPGATAGTPPVPASEQPSPDPAKTAMTLYKLTNLGVVSMNAGDYETAISKLEEALSIDKNHTVARQNLAIAYNNYGLKLKDKPMEALKIYHKAIALDPGNTMTRSNLEALISIIGKNPGSFQDRVWLAEQALSQGDKIGARLEYQAALKLKNDPAILAKLNSLDQPKANIVNASVTPPVKTTAPPANQHKIVPKTASTPKPGVKTSPPSAKKSQAASRPLPKTQPKSGGSSQSKAQPPGSALDKVYAHLKGLELKLFQKVFESDDLLTRLQRLEKKTFGKTQSGNTRRRLDALLLAN